MYVIGVGELFLGKYFGELLTPMAHAVTNQIDNRENTAGKATGAGGRGFAHGVLQGERKIRSIQQMIKVPSRKGFLEEEP
jgi:hypothetical protein